MQRKLWYFALGASALLGPTVGCSQLHSAPPPTAAASPTESAARPAPPDPAPAPVEPPPDPYFVLGPYFDILDCDREGLIDTGQIDEHFTQLFGPLDMDRSRNLTPGEFIHHTQHRSRSRQEAAFKMADKDGDDLVSVNEFLAFYYGMVEAADTNRDGEVDLQELRASDLTRKPAAAAAQAEH